MKKKSLFFLAMTLILLACAPQETVTSVPTVTLPSPTTTPVPTQIEIILENTPPDYLTGSLEKAYIPNDSIIPRRNYSFVIQTLNDLGFIPIMGDDGVFVFVGADQKNIALPLESFTTLSSGEVFNLIGNVDSDGIAHYQSADGTIDKWGIMSIWCRTVCIQAMSYNQEDEGQVFWLEISPSSGQLEGYFPVFYDEKPVWGKETQHLEINGKMIWFMPILDKWNAPLTGKNALWKMESVKGISYETGILTFISNDTTQEATDDQIYWQPDFGGYIINQEGIFVWDEQSLEWIKSQADENIADGAEIFIVGETKFVLIDGKMRVVISTENDDGVTKISFSTDENRKYVWEGQKWVVWYAEKKLKEIPVCESMYDVLTPKNELNPEHRIDSKDLQAVANWVQTQLTEDMFDVTKLKLLTDVGMSSPVGIEGKFLIPNTNTAPNYEDSITAPFLKNNQWCASTLINDESYLVIFVPYYIKGTVAKEWPVLIGVRPLLAGRGGAWPIAIEYYLDRMNVVPWLLNSASIDIAMQYSDHLTGENFTRERVQQIFNEMGQGDFSNGHGLVLYFLIGRNSGGWFE